MDPELVSYLDQRFAELDRRFDAVDRRFDAVDQQFDAVNQQFDAVDQQFDTVNQRFAGVDGRFEALRADVRGDIAASEAETRRHFAALMEQVMTQVRLVADGVVTVDQKVDRLADEMRDGFHQVDRRFLKLEAQVASLSR
ncbi:MAG: hypothetical protein HY216_02610 [Candidatus Rokubacteria bacterium]|nr:hypothetical protein [Candidatus Rokubacteria bacterium]